MAKQQVEAVLVRMPAKTKKAVFRKAVSDGTNMTVVINEILAEALGTEYTPGNKRAAPFGGGRRKPVAA